MTNHINDISQRNAGIIAGVGFLITIAGVIFASICGTTPDIIVQGDAEQQLPKKSLNQETCSGPVS